MKTVVFLTCREYFLANFFKNNYTFIALNCDCRGPIHYVVISAREPREMVTRLDARMERLIGYNIKASTAMQLRPSLCWGVKHLTLVLYRHFGIAYSSWTAWTLKKSPILCREMSACKCQNKLRNIPEERRPQSDSFLQNDLDLESIFNTLTTVM